VIRRFSRPCVVAVVAALLGACAPIPTAPPGPPVGAPPDFPHAYYRQLQSRGLPVFDVDAARSQVVIEVRRGGSLARLGHDHVVASHSVAGTIAPGDGRADFHVALDTLTVDEPDLRAAAGFTTQPDADDIAGTRRNMYKVLEIERYPYVLLGVHGAASEGKSESIRLDVTLHGVTRTVDAIASWGLSGEEFAVSGQFAIDQSAFGMTPLSILSGAITVQDRLNVAFRILAGPVKGAAR
jgi:polyisoprenoid-binding protein YceI